MTGFAVSTEIKNVVVILSEAKNLYSGVRSDPEILRFAQDDAAGMIVTVRQLNSIHSPTVPTRS
jgi:hypothetical protein